MRFWLSRDTIVPIREQLGAQIILGILSRRFPPGQRLPSVGELARRLKIHANTVSAVYQDLAERGWVTRRAGAGVFVSARVCQPAASSATAFAERVMEEGLAQGFSRADLQEAFTAALQDEEAPLRMVVADSDEEMARILAAEIAEAIGTPIQAMKLDALAKGLPPGTCVLGSEAHSTQIQNGLAGRSQFRPIQLKSMQEVIAGQNRPEQPVLICVASRSESILRWSATLLSALGFPPDSVIQRNSSVAGWDVGLGACDIIAADLLTAPKVSAKLPVVVFRIVSEEFLATLKSV